MANTSRISVGASGTSKSFLSVYSALDLYNNDKRRTITYIRTAIESASKGLGFLKGGIDQKISPYLKPLEDKISDILSPQEKDTLTKGQVLAGEPINFIRGQDWKHKWLLLMRCRRHRQRASDNNDAHKQKHQIVYLRRQNAE